METKETPIYELCQKLFTLEWSTPATLSVFTQPSTSVTSVTKDHFKSRQKIPHNTMIYDAIPYKIQGNLTNFTQQFMSSLFIYVVIYLFVCYRYTIYPACLAHSAFPRGSRHIPSSANSGFILQQHTFGGVSKTSLTTSIFCCIILFKVYAMYMYLSRKPRYHDNTLSSAGLWKPSDLHHLLAATCKRRNKQNLMFVCL